jgi:hypothetical protein
VAKDPSPKADQQRAMREARYGHIQATAEPKAEKLQRARKLIPFAGKENKGVAPKGSVPPPRNKRKSGKAKRRTKLPSEKGPADA